LKPEDSRDELLILIPTFNDWVPLARLLTEIDAVVSTLRKKTRVVLIDDGSTEPIPKNIECLEFASLYAVGILHLRRNLGHQRAIAVGLAYIEANLPCDAVVVMDGDGEDLPDDIPRMLERFTRHRGENIVFAARLKRSESWLFRIFYHGYRLLHYLCTGISVRVGNFSVIPSKLLRRLVVVSDLWNHYAASVIKARLPFETVDTRRGTRYAGESRMNFVALVVHGLSAISV
jgi:glycosyltransferase involved in cell wall biosynthesis